MKSFDNRTPLGTIIKAGIRTIAMAIGHPKLHDFVVKFRGTHDKLDESKYLAYKAENDVLWAEGEAELVATLCYEDVDDLQHDLEGVTGKDYAGPLYKAFFPKGLPAFKDQSPEELVQVLPIFIQTLKDSGEAKLVAHVPTFERHLTALRKPLENLLKTRTKLATVSLALGQSREAWMDGYASLEGQFNATLPRRKRLVGSFFPRAGGNDGKKTKDELKIEELEARNAALEQQVAELQAQLAQKVG